jgi:glycosyltransferase involved in cell wall biosynthesis
MLPNSQSFSLLTAIREITKNIMTSLEHKMRNGQQHLMHRDLRMRIALISSRFSPEASPGAKRVTDLSIALQAAGYRTTILTQMPSYPDQKAFESYFSNGRRLMVEKDAIGNELWRFRPQLTPKKNLPARLLSEARFARRVSKSGTHLSDFQGVFTSSPFMFNLCAARSYRLPMWLDLRDLTWEYSRKLGSKSPLKVMGSLLLKYMAINNFKAAKKISTTTNRQRQYLINHGVRADRIQVVPNGVPNAVVNKLIQLSENRNKDAPLKVVYAGLLGFPQGLDFAVKSMEYMDPGEAELHLYGDGVDRAKLINYCKSKNLCHIFFHGHVSYEDYLKAIAEADILYASLRPEKCLAAAMPSKIWEYMAAGKPVLFAGEGEAAEAIEHARAGLSIAFGDANEFKVKLKRFIQNPAYRFECGNNGRNWVLKKQIREKINKWWVEAIEEAFICQTKVA